MARVISAIERLASQGRTLEAEAVAELLLHRAVAEADDA